jgi:hypothetical protein
MFPTFTNFALLGGLAAIAAPILIHLLLRRKSQRMRFSSVQFFLKQDEQSMRKRKLRNLLLLSTRLLLFTLLALAFARPFFPASDAIAQAGEMRQLVILLDTSASMQAVTPDGPLWSRALDAVRKELAALKLNDRAALITCSTRAELISEFAPASVVMARLKELKPTYGKAQLQDGFRQVTKVLATANPAFKPELCIISDLQRTGLENIGTQPLPHSLTARMIDLGERFIPNVAVTSLQIETSDELFPQATVTSFSDEPLRASYQLKVDGKEVFSGVLALDSGATTNISLALPALSPGWHSAEFAIESTDSLPADNIAFATIFVPNPVHGLVVEPRSVPKIFLEESYFVATALNPVRDPTLATPSRFSYSKTTLYDLPARLQPVPGQPRVEYIVLPGVKSLPNESLNALRNFVLSGGGLILFLGPDTSAIQFARLGELLPAQLGKIESAHDPETGWRLTNYDTTTPIFALFREPNSGNLSLPQFSHRFALTPNSAASIIASFDDGTPLLLTRQAGHGRIVLVNSSADTTWTDWPKHKSFVPWLHATTRYVTRRDQPHERESLPNAVTGAELTIDLAESNHLKSASISPSRQSLILQHVGGREISLDADDDRLDQEVLLESPGIYILKDGAGNEIRRLAANLPSAESDLSAFSPSEIEQQIVRTAVSDPHFTTAGLFGSSSNRKEFWRVLLFGALALLLLEPFLANRIFA